MRVKILCLLLLFSIFACNKKQDAKTLPIEKDKDSLLIKEKDVSKLVYTDYILDDRTEAIALNWFEYIKLQELINKTKKGDLSYFNNDTQTIKDLLKNLKQTIPVELNTPSILARIVTLETKFYKIESLLKIGLVKKSELLPLIKELLVAFSNLNLQMNKKLEADTIIIEKPF